MRRLPLLPALIFTIVVTQFPFLLTIWYSLQSWNLLHPTTKHFAGLDNYKTIATDSLARTALLNTVILTLVPVLLSMAIGLGIALLLDRKVMGRGLLRSLIVSPFLVMPAAAALVWKFTLLDTQFGLINWVLKPFGVNHVDWINKYPKGTIITVLTWQWTPFMVLILLAGLQSQPTDVLEAARVDGASSWQIFRWMTLPHLRQYMELGIVLGSIYLVQGFDAIFMITSGGRGRRRRTSPTTSMRWRSAASTSAGRPPSVWWWSSSPSWWPRSRCAPSPDCSATREWRAGYDLPDVHPPHHRRHALEESASGGPTPLQRRRHGTQRPHVGHRAAVLLPGVLDGADRLQEGVGRGDRPAALLFQTDPVAVPLRDQRCRAVRHSTR